MMSRILPKALIAALVLAAGLDSAALAVAAGAAPSAPSLAKYADSRAKGEALARYAEDYDIGWVDLYIKAKLTLFDARGKSVERALRQTILEGEAGNKSLFRFLSPAGIRGVSVLMHEHPKATDESWLYLPSSRRVRRISGANRSASFQGTEFTYEDLATFESARYDWDYVGEDEVVIDGKKVKTHVLRAKPRFRDTGYGYLEQYFNPETARFVKVKFYDKASRHLKTLTGSNYKRIHDRYWRAHRLEMKNVQNGKKTVFEIEVLLMDLSRYKDTEGNPRPNLSEADFTQRALEKQ